MTKKKAKKKNKPTLTPEDFAFLCEMVMRGADQELDDIWDEMNAFGSRYDDPQDADGFLIDAVTDEEVKLFHRVDRLLNTVARRFGFARPLYRGDMPYDAPKQEPVAKKPAQSPPPPPLVVAKAL